MVKSTIFSILIILTLNLSGCSIGVAGLQSHVDPIDGYQFLYPNGWIEVKVPNAAGGVDVVFRDLIERGENLSVIISDIDPHKTLEEVGSPSEVGYRFMEMVNQNPNSERQAELINAEKHQLKDKNYYILEYEVKLPNNQTRHNLASVVTDRGKLFTFNLSTSEKRWQRVNKLFTKVVNSFSLSS